MKRGIKEVSLLLMVVLVSLLSAQEQKAPGVPTRQAALPGGQAPTVLDAGARLNPMKIAELKWYISPSSTHFPVGNQP